MDRQGSSSLSYSEEMNVSAIAKRWRMLSGQDNWRGLLKPLDLDLRKYLIHYGERAQVTYDTFNYNMLSPYAGSSKFAKEDLFAKVGLQKGNPYKYNVTKYFYATSQLEFPGSFLLNSKAKNSWLKKSNFIGYIAVATDKGKEVLGRRDILIAWRGTIHPLEWVEDATWPLVKADEVFGKNTNVRVHQGWLSMYTSVDQLSRFNKTSCRDQILSEVKKLMEQYKNEDVSITVTGHSLGASMATLNAVDIAANGFNKAKGSNKECLVTAFAYASPNVGGSRFKELYTSTGNVRVLKIRNMPDIVPRSTPPPTYVPVGEELQFDSRDSGYLKPEGNIATWHDLEGSYLHVLAGTHGVDKDFKLEVKRDIALVNKISDALKAKYLVPPYWWGLANLGMIQQNDGSWKLFDHQKERKGFEDLGMIQQNDGSWKLFDHQKERKGFEDEEEEEPEE